MFHVKPMTTAFLLFAAVLCGPALAVYRCTGADGRVTFSDTPCVAGQQGGAVQIRPVTGVAISPNKTQTPPTQPPATVGGNSPDALQKRAAEYEAMLTPECRRARQAFVAKANQIGGMDELMQEGNPVSKAWEACQFEAKDAIDKLSAQDRARIDADNKKRQEQEAAQIRKSECDAKRDVLAKRQSQAAKPSEQDRAALQALAQEVANRCR